MSGWEKPALLCQARPGAPRVGLWLIVLISQVQGKASLSLSLVLAAQSGLLCHLDSSPQTACCPGEGKAGLEADGMPPMPRFLPGLISANVHGCLDSGGMHISTSLPWPVELLWLSTPPFLPSFHKLLSTYHGLFQALGI